MLAILLTIFGIGFLLFIHELGHFLAARAAGVRVEVFAIGMGPRVVGFRRGDTDYRIAALPIGGYVQMAGENSLDRSAPDSLHSKSVAARFFIYSGGILMNFAFALLMIPILFRIGVPMQVPVAGSVTPGTPAWEAGIEPGARFTELDDSRMHSFADFASTVALSNIEKPLRVHFVDHEGQPQQVAVAARADGPTGLPRLGVGPMSEFVVAADSAAVEAGLRADETIVGFGGVLLAESPGVAESIVTEAALTGSPLLVAVERDGQIKEFVVEAKRMVAPEAQLGVFEAHGRVTRLREGHGTGLREGDFVLQAGTRAVRSASVVVVAAAELGHLPELEVLREGERLLLPAEPQVSPRQFAAHVHLEPDPDAVRLVVREDGAAARAGLRSGDQLLRVGTEDLTSFQNLRNALAAADGAPLALQLLRDDQVIDLQVSAGESAQFDHGILAGMLRETVRETGFLAAVSTGLVQARTMVRQVFLSFQRILTGAIPATNLGGIITIGRTGHHFATNGIVPFLFFLCMISVHLGVLNLLPIPALDGGHLFFLLIEAIRGRPVSEKILLWFNFSGFVLIMGLVIFVTILDINRIVP